MLRRWQYQHHNTTRRRGGGGGCGILLGVLAGAMLMVSMFNVMFSDNNRHYDDRRIVTGKPVKTVSVVETDYIALTQHPNKLIDIITMQQPKQNTPCPTGTHEYAHFYGNFDELRCSYAFRVLQLPQSPAAAAVTLHIPPIRLYYARDPTRYYRCQGLRRAVLALTANPSPPNPMLEQATKACNANGTHDNLTAIVSSSSQALSSWLRQDEFGQKVMSAIIRAHSCCSHGSWQQSAPSALVSFQAHVFPHSVSPPSQEHGRQFALVRNCTVSEWGHLVPNSPPSHDPLAVELFYPYRAHYSYDILMEKYDQVTNSYTPLYDQRKKFAARKPMEDTTNCTTIAHNLDVMGRFMDKIPCGRGGNKALAVARVLVITQVYTDRVFHLFSETLPRLGYFLDALRLDTSWHIHVECVKLRPLCVSILDTLGIETWRLIEGRVIAAQVVMPEGGYRHWPLGNLWRLHDIRKAILERVMTPPVTHRARCDVQSRRSHTVLLVKRSSTKLTGFTREWYDLLKNGLEHDMATLRSVPGISISVRMFDDRDTSIMKSFASQVKEFHNADVIVGAHGAGLSLVMFSKPCAHVVSIRDRHGSEVYEHLALGFGLGFHHVLFGYNFARMFRDVQTSVMDALLDDVGEMPPHVTLACIVVDGDVDGYVPQICSHMVVLTDVITGRITNSHVVVLSRNVVLSAQILSNRRAIRDLHTFDLVAVVDNAHHRRCAAVLYCHVENESCKNMIIRAVTTKTMPTFEDIVNHAAGMSVLMRFTSSGAQSKVVGSKLNNEGLFWEPSLLEVDSSTSAAATCDGLSRIFHLQIMAPYTSYSCKFNEKNQVVFDNLRDMEYKPEMKLVQQKRLMSEDNNLVGIGQQACGCFVTDRHAVMVIPWELFKRNGGGNDMWYSRPFPVREFVSHQTPTPESLGAPGPAVTAVQVLEAFTTNTLM